ncbi:hypothetical protein [Streptomyces hesseae]|uniref:MftR C-terminal domain-containing protein n=1 Tax=Streptomyces hesseae TaxID=3075519 RepID=A0ABU2SXQ6_9ACTN|nr:hypothetical protein [Streptomyces sp. DSM 40473]MDT0453788.1 hypothetical protein [Streptomyces sp. DSM 40473]
MKLLLERAGDEPEILVKLMEDAMWDQWARTGGIAPMGRLGEAAVALSTVQYLGIPGWAEDLERYQDLLENLLATSAMATSPPHPATVPDSPLDSGCPAR